LLDISSLQGDVLEGPEHPDRWSRRWGTDCREESAETRPSSVALDERGGIFIRKCGSSFAHEFSNFGEDTLRVETFLKENGGRGNHTDPTRTVRYPPARVRNLLEIAEQIPW